MRVLIADFDLFRNVGGGQIVYRSHIQRHPAVQFYYFRHAEAADAPRPPNAHAIPFREVYRATDFNSFHDLDPPIWIYGAFLRASNIAASVTGLQFDVVDTPDYEQAGTLLRPALRYHHADCGRVALSMHGRISKTIRHNWWSAGHANRALELQEEMQYRVVDTRYGISEAYLEEWRKLVDLEAHLLHPLRVVSLPTPTVAPPSPEPPGIHYVGRTERGKGPDLFVELASWLPRSSYGTARIIGPDCVDPQGVSSSHWLQSMAERRFLDVDILPALSQEAILRLFASRGLTVLPSRHDTLNLVALESIFSGCPTALGTGAGACRFLEQTLPQVPWVRIDIHDVLAALPAIRAVLEHYDEYREQLVEALHRARPAVSGPTLEEIYSSAPVGDPALRADLERWYGKLMAFHGAAGRARRRRARAAVKGVLRASLPLPARKGLRRLREQLRPRTLVANAKAEIVSRYVSADPGVATHALRARHLAARYRDVFYAPEQSEKDIAAKLQKCWGVACDFRIDRVRIWREIARLERLRGNALMAATYELRAMRALGEDRFGDLPATAAALRAHGFPREAQVAEAMYGGPGADRVARCRALVDDALTRNRTAPTFEYELLDDRRRPHQYRVSIIVSLYNAAPKLHAFLQALQYQTLIQAGAAEIILIDSGSPGGEYAEFQRLARALETPIVYARSARRETIQAAWNRGITLARGRYLTFLGTDETIFPDCLETLAAELDADFSLDWVEGHSLCTNVDVHGVWSSDIMLYDRTGYRQDLVYLEGAYLSWVGALYRRSIHDRCGLYDASFGAAGDTEFKNRVLPFVKTKVVPRTLGVFWNYPEERTTQSPRAELEDLRAWYLHRTLAGVQYAFSTRAAGEAGALLYDALRYRKSFCRHWSTDVEYAHTVATFLRTAGAASSALAEAEAVGRVLSAYRSLDVLGDLAPLAALGAVRRAGRVIVETAHAQHTRRGDLDPAYAIFNDNRHEQHVNVWESPTTAPAAAGSPT